MTSTDRSERDLNREPDPILANFEERQRSSGRTVDEFLWRGDPKATPIQRAGLVLFSSLLLLLSVMFVVAAVKFMSGQDWLVKLMALLAGGFTGVVGLRLCFNAWKH